MRATCFLAAAAALTISASQALAWGDMYMGDTTGDPYQEPLVQAYPAPNYCPAGKQPVIVGGVICCGVPTAGTYYNPVSKPKPAVKKVVKTKTYLPRAYAPVGEKGVVYK
ncbi:hypothetical protein M4578_21300 [Salipiger sp. P9]|uniref:hypothetical protein n=1 Tax=Salipiger pentaromativorans TaxID=2943193 RepID=UPI0021572F97|nr:hypothetical protein [Salipiger pentaromativorans]MCR8550367.1 hypothetical protein [Salipiger pentaromativorans]